MLASRFEATEICVTDPETGAKRTANGTEDRRYCQIGDEATTAETQKERDLDGALGNCPPCHFPQLLAVYRPWVKAPPQPGKIISRSLQVGGATSKMVLEPKTTAHFESASASSAGQHRKLDRSLRKLGRCNANLVLFCSPKDPAYR